MVNEYEEKPKKRFGCLGVILIILLVMGLIAGTIFLLLPKILSSAVSGGAVSTVLPKGIQENIKELQKLVSANISLLNDYGLTTDEAVRIMESLDYKTIEVCLEDIQKSSINNSSDLIDTVSKHVDLSSADLGRIKKDINTDFREEELNLQIEKLRESPAMSRSGFSMLKNTIIEVLKSHDKTGSK